LSHGKTAQAITIFLGTIGLIVGGWLGYELAGPIGVLVFTPLGALAGSILNILD
jgi:hypothetical protein